MRAGSTTTVRTAEPGERRSLEALQLRAAQISDEQRIQLTFAGEQPTRFGLARTMKKALPTRFLALWPV